MKVKSIIKYILLLLFYMMIVFVSGKLVSGCIIMVLIGEYRILALMIIVLCLYAVWNVYKDVTKKCITVYGEGGFN